MLDGRVVEQPLVLTQLVRKGSFPLATWKEDVERPEVRCLVLQSDWLERSAGTSPDHDLFPDDLRPALKARFGRAGAASGIWIYRAR